MVIVDSRELSTNLGTFIWQSLDRPEHEMLDHGDYLIRGIGITALVERVTATGLLEDMKSGRMVDKLRGCAFDADLVFLLVEGLLLPDLNGKVLAQTDDGTAVDNLHEDYTRMSIDCRRTRWNWDAVCEFLTSVQLRWVHGIDMTTSVFDSVKAIRRREAYLAKPRHDLHLVRSRPFSMGAAGTDLGEYVLAAFPGIGAKRAADIMRYTEGRIPLRWTIGEDELRQVPGIGKATAQRILQHLPPRHKGPGAE